MNHKQSSSLGTIVKKSNALARAKWAPQNIYEPRIVALVASCVQVDDEDLHSYLIPAKGLLGNNFGGKDQKELCGIVDSLMSRVLTLQSDERGWAKYQIFIRCRYHRDKGLLDVQFHPDLKQHYLGLKKHFTKYSLAEFLSLKSTYSQRLFEILKSWSNKPEITLKIESLHEMLQTPNSQKKNFGEFRRRALEKAYKDINENTSLRYEWEPIKTGRKVTEIRFVFSPIRQQALASKKTDEQSQNNNKLFFEAVACWKKQAQICVAPNSRTPEVCRICKKHIQ